MLTQIEEKRKEIGEKGYKGVSRSRSSIMKQYHSLNWEKKMSAFNLRKKEKKGLATYVFVKCVWKCYPKVKIPILLNNVFVC